MSCECKGEKYKQKKGKKKSQGITLGEKTEAK